MELNDFNRNENGGISFMLEVDDKEYQPFLNAASKNLQEEEPITGYRKETAPLIIAKEFYGERLFKKANEDALYYFFKKVCNDYGFQPVSSPMINVIKNDLNGIAVSYSFYNYPELKSLKYKGLEVEKPVKISTEAEIHEKIDEYMQNHLYVHEVDRGAKQGDVIEVSFNARTLSGEHFPYDHSNKLKYFLGEDLLFTGLDALIEGHKKGDVIKATLKLPENFHRKEVAGLTIVTKVILKGVWQRDVLECTDEYVKEHINGCDNLTDFRGKIRKDLQKANDETSAKLFERNLRKAIASEVSCTIPKAMVNVQLKRVEKELEAYSKKQGSTINESLDAEGKTLQQVLEDNYEGCEEDVKVSIALDYVAKAENLKVTEKELNRRLNRYALQRGLTLDELSQKDNYIDFQEKACEELLNEKAEQVIRDNLKVNEVEYDELPSPF